MGQWHNVLDKTKKRPTIKLDVFKLEDSQIQT